MEDFERDIRRHNLAQQIRIGNQFSEFDFSKGEKGQEGEVRTWKDGTKVRKTGGKWIPISEKSAKPQKQQAPSVNKKPGDIKTQSKPESSIDKVSRHEIAKLTSIKKLHKTDPERAHELAESLSEEAKSVIPQSVWNDIVSNVAKSKDSEVSEKEPISSAEDIVSLMKSSGDKSAAYEAFNDLSKEKRWEVEDLMDDDDLYDDLIAETKKVHKEKVNRMIDDRAKSVDPKHKSPEEVRKSLKAWASEYKLSTKDLDKGIEEYQSKSYKEINNYLRGESESISKYGKDAISRLDKVMKLAASTIKEDIVTYRAMPKGSFYDGLKVGEIIEDKAYQSTSPDTGVVIKRFDGYRGFVAKINIKKGSRGIPASQLTGNKGHESEILLDRNVKYRVDRVDEKNKTIELTLI